MRKLLKILLNIFRFIGVDPRYQNCAAKCLRTVCLSGGLFILLTYILEIALNWQGVKSLAKLNMLPAVLMFLVKTMTLQLKNKNLLEIVKKIDTFPDYTRYGPVLNKQLDNIFNRATRASTVFLVVSIICCLAFFITPFFSEDPSFLFTGYDFCDLRTSPCFEITFAWQNIIIIGMFYPSVMGFDCLFMHFVAEAYCVVEVIKHALSQMKTEVLDGNEIGDIVEFHINGLSYIKELNRFYHNVLLVQMWFSLGGLILSLYMMTSEGIPPPFHLLAKYGTLYMALASQLFIYCFGGAIIIDQTKTVGDTAFGVDWWSETKPQLRRTLLLVIERSQRVEKIRVGKLMDLNLETFVTVLKNSMSVYTLLLTVEKKANMLQE